jgi:hypothetical protein
MITIKRTDTSEYFDTSADMAFTMKIESPYFSPLEESDYTLPFRLPRTANNRRILGFIDSLDVTAPFPENIPVEIASGSIIQYAQMNVSSTSPEGISVYVIYRQKWKDMLNTLLPTIDFGGDRAITTTDGGDWASMKDHAKDVAYSDPLTYDYTFAPIHNPNLHANATTIDGSNAAHTYSGIVNLYDPNNDTFFDIPNVFRIAGDGYMQSYMSDEKVPTISSFVPFPYLVYVINRVAAHMNLRVLSSWIMEPATQKLIIYNTYTLDAVSERTFGIDTYWVMDSDTQINLKNHVPKISISDFLGGLAEMFNLRIEIDRETLIIEPMKINSIQLGGSLDKYISPENTIELASQDKGYSYILQPDSNCEVSSSFGDRTIIYENTGNDIPNPASFPSLDPEGYVRFCVDSYQDHNKHISTGAKKNVVVTSATALKIDNGETQKLIRCNTLVTTRNLKIPYIDPTVAVSTPTTLILETGVIPMANQEGQSTYYSIGEEGNYTFRILSYCGIVNNPQGKPVPMATQHVYDYDGNLMPDTYSLKWIGTAQSLYEKWHKPWQFQRQRKIKKRMQLTEPAFLTLDLKKKYIMQGREVIITSLSVPFTHQGIETIVFEGIVLS